jgi:protein-disulfide isomerase
MRRLPLPLALLALSAVGATCKGQAPQAEPEAATPGRDAPLVRAPAVSELEGVEIRRVPPARRADALRILNETFSYCGCARTVAACLADRASCSCPNSSTLVAEFVIEAFETGATTGEVETALVDAFSEGYQQEPRAFDLEGQPSLGPDLARHTLVEFADFRCPHCKDAYGDLVRFARGRKDVRLVYYFFPLSGFGEPSIRAAKAAEAARRQGEFWEMAELLYANQTALEEADIRGYAQAAGLDLEQFEADYASEAVEQAVFADKKIGTAAGVQGTPAIFLNGRRLELPHDPKNLALRIAMENDREVCD